MDIAIPIFLDIYLIYKHFCSAYNLKRGFIKSTIEISIVIIITSVFNNLISSSIIGQVCTYFAAMPVILFLFKGRLSMRIMDYLKIVLAFTAVNLLAAYLSRYIKQLGYENSAFLLFIFFAIMMRLLIYFIFKQRKQRNKIHYFEISKYKGILTRFIFVFISMIIMISLALNEGITNGKGNLSQLQATLLVLLVILLLNIYENIEEVVGNLIEKMMSYQQEEIKHNYLGIISERTQELLKIKHDIKDHMFMVNYLVEKGNLNEIKSYLDKIIFVEKELMLIPQKEWMNSFIYSKIMTARKKGITLEVKNEWNQDLYIKIDDMDLLSLLSNLINNSIEALEYVEAGEKKRSILKLKQRKEYLLIDIFNYYNCQYLRLSAGRLLTTKKDKRMHGKGMNIVKDIVTKYEGGCDYKFIEDKIYIEATLKNKQV